MVTSQTVIFLAAYIVLPTLSCLPCPTLPSVLLTPLIHLMRTIQWSAIPQWRYFAPRLSTLLFSGLAKIFVSPHVLTLNDSAASKELCDLIVHVIESWIGRFPKWISCSTQLALPCHPSRRLASVVTANIFAPGDMPKKIHKTRKFSTRKRRPNSYHVAKVKPFVSRGTFSLIGTIEGQPDVVLKYPKRSNDLCHRMIEVERVILEHLGPHLRLVR